MIVPARSKTNPCLRILGLILVSLATIGCDSTDVQTTYGRSRGQSINGTNVLADLIRRRGHTVRAAVRYNEVLANWADVLIRFAPHPGPPSEAEAEWLTGWLGSGSARKLIYVVRDYDTGPEFWARMLAALPPSGMETERTRIKSRQTESQGWATSLPARAKEPADRDSWFGTAPGNPARPNEVTTCQTLTGPWADGIDAKAAALPVHEAIQADNDEEIFLDSDAGKLVVRWTYREDENNDEGEVLILANGSFLLNAGLLNQARRPLAIRVADWVGDAPRHVAFVEGSNVLDAEGAGTTSPFHLLTVTPFNWIGGHLAAFGLLFALALAPTLGRPRPEPSGAIERPSAHPIALGAILARTAQADHAREIMSRYRQWRHPAGSTGPTGSTSPTPHRASRA